ncbi:MAG: hypothetical protein KAH17_07645 [Bacteroidales bacterium]|nr:hypothetical protein [Bacteroidales bacterium]
MKKSKVFSPFLLLLISSVLVFTSCDRSTDDLVEPSKATIAKAGKLYSNSSIDVNNSNNKLFSEVVGTIRPGQSIKILESNRFDDYKVQLSDGSMGWIEAEYIVASKHTFIKHNSSGDNRHIASNRGAIGTDRKIVKEVNEKTAVTRLEEYREVKSAKNILNWTKVRTEDGIEGWLMSDYLFRIAIDSHRYIQRKEWRYDKSRFIESWKGKSIEDFTDKYKEPSGIKIADGQNILYFNNFFLFDKNDEYYGVRVYVKDDLIENIDAGAHKTSYVSYMPLASLMRINILSNYVGNWNYLFESDQNPNGIVIDIRDYVPGWLSWVIVIVILLIALGILYLILKIPFFIVNKFTYKQSLNRKLFNGRIKLYATLGSLILGYTFYLFLVVNVYPFHTLFFIITLFCLGMILGNINKWRNDLDYNRCNAIDCHQWTGEHLWTEYLGGSTTTQTVSYGDGSTETNQQTTRRYREHRKCSACGYEWSIIRTEVIGNLKV